MTEGEIELAFFGLSIAAAFLSMRIILDLDGRNIRLWKSRKENHGSDD